MLTRLHGVTCQKSVVFTVSAIPGVECLVRKCIGKCWVSLAAQKCKFYVLMFKFGVVSLIRQYLVLRDVFADCQAMHNPYFN